MPSGASTSGARRESRRCPRRARRPARHQIADVGVAVDRARIVGEVAAGIDAPRHLGRGRRSRQAEVARDVAHVVGGIGRVVGVARPVIDELLDGDGVAARIHRAGKAQQRVDPSRRSQHRLEQAAGAPVVEPLHGGADEDLAVGGEQHAIAHAGAPRARLLTRRRRAPGGPALPRDGELPERIEWVFMKASTACSAATRAAGRLPVANHTRAARRRARRRSRRSAARRRCLRR